jgi:hypothetical protein
MVRRGDSSPRLGIHHAAEKANSSLTENEMLIFLS